MDESPNNLLQNAPCPECDTPIPLPSELKTGKIIECPACAVECEIISADPLKLAPLEEEK